MAAPKGNKNAEKWTEKTVLAELKKIEKFIENPGRFYFVTAALAQLGHHNDIWSYWKYKFEKNLDVTNKILKIEKLASLKPIARRLKFIRNNHSNLKSINNKITQKYKTDSSFRLKISFQTLLNYHLRKSNIESKYTTSKLIQKKLGYSIEDLKNHLESNFKAGMTWENYGRFWQVDHIIPASWFKCKSHGDEEFKQCWRLENLKPEYASINFKKSNRYTENPQMRFLAI